jgi:hypothetical protein
VQSRRRRAGGHTRAVERRAGVIVAQIAGGVTALFAEKEIMAGLRQAKDREGIAMSVQVRRALVAWLE